MLFDQISTDIMAAMKAKDKVRTQALRNIKKYFIEAKTAPGNNGELTDEAAMKILANLPNKVAILPNFTPNKIAPTLQKANWQK